MYQKKYSSGIRLFFKLSLVKEFVILQKKIFNNSIHLYAL